MIFIGLDQSSKIVGYCVMTEDQIITYGTYKAVNSNILMERVDSIVIFLENLITKYQEQNIVIGLEDTQESRQNTNTFQLLSKVLGILEYWIYKQKIPYMVCHVSSWRHHSNIKGKKRQEKKKNAIKAVSDKFGIQAEEDAAEAILICDYLRAEHLKKIHGF
jgi:Holliday junction resolvasome RuvABC endonuclease subunit